MRFYKALKKENANHFPPPYDGAGGTFPRRFFLLG